MAEVTCSKLSKLCYCTETQQRGKEMFYPGLRCKVLLAKHRHSWIPYFSDCKTHRTVTRTQVLEEENKKKKKPCPTAASPHPESQVSYIRSIRHTPIFLPIFFWGGGGRKVRLIVRKNHPQYISYIICEARSDGVAHQFTLRLINKDQFLMTLFFCWWLGLQLQLQILLSENENYIEQLYDS